MLGTAFKRMSATKNVRQIYYRVMAAQMSLGVSLERAIRTAAATLPSNTLAKAFGERVDAAASAGSKLTEDWAASGWLPHFDSIMLILAEREGPSALSEAFSDLAEDEAQVLTFKTAVLGKNAYSLAVFAVAMTFLWLFADLLEQIAGRYPQVLEGQLAYALSIGLREWGLAGAVVIAILVVLHLFVLSNMIPPQRQLVGWMTYNYDLRIAHTYLTLAGKMAARGASHTQVVSLLLSVIKGRYARESLRKIQYRLKRGDDYMNAVRSIIPKRFAQVLAGMAPAGERGILSKAYRSVAVIVEEVLRGRYSKIAAIFKSILMALNGVIVLTLVQGMYGTTSDMTAIIGAAR